MVSFAQLWDTMQRLKEDTFQDDKSMEAIRTGNNIRDDFWDDFISLTNNSDAVAELLGVRTDQVTGWSAKIKDTISRVQKSDQNDGDDDQDKKNHVLPTGSSLGDAAGMDAHDTADTRPMP